jgi:hypothetical protein
MKKHFKMKLGIGLVAVALAAVVGVAYATIPDSNGVIHACYNKSTGTLRVIDSSVTNCPSNDTALNWNVQGPQGPQGPAGPQGATGPQGPAGPTGPSGLSHGYLATSSAVAVPQEPAYSNVVSISSVPNGSYMIYAQADLTDSSTSFALCIIKVNGTALPNAGVEVQLVNGVGTGTMVWAATLSGGASFVEVDCTNQDDNTSVASVNLSLVTVDALN